MSGWIAAAIIYFLGLVYGRALNNAVAEKTGEAAPPMAKAIVSVLWPIIALGVLVSCPLRKPETAD